MSRLHIAEPTLEVKHGDRVLIMHPLPDTYDTEICDFCGHSVKCDYYVSDDEDAWKQVAYDICSKCQKKLIEEAKE